MLHARFPRMERESALAEAKELETSLKLQVRVVRETYYTDNNAFEEAEIYVTGGKVERAVAQAKSGGGGGKSSWGAPGGSGGGASKPAAAAGKARRGKPAPKSFSGGKLAMSEVEVAQARQVLSRLLAIGACGLAVALLAIKITPNIIMGLWKMGFGIKVDAASYSQLLMVVFALAFLMTSVPLALKFMPRKGGGGRSRPATFAPAPAPVAGRPKAISKEMKKSLDKLAKEAESVPPPQDDGDDDLPPLDLDLDDDKSLVEEVAEVEREQNKEQQEKPAKEEPAPTQSVEAQLPKVGKFLNGAMEAVRQERITMDNYNRFAMHLYMAGAVEAMIEFRKLGAKAMEPLMEEALEQLGTRGESARNFHDKLPEYRREARYKSVVEAGRNAMGNFLLGDEMGAHLAIRDIYRDWNRKTDQKQGQMMTVLFTDMVDSTNMTQIRGDAAAQEIVRRHNLIVRGALSRFGGHEVKHTGDGIMASFLSAAGAIDAMVQVQRQVAEHNARMPSQVLHLRIGLNAGEPIQEEDDLFGSTVQLAARVCAATGTDEIYCTASVMELAGKPGSMFRSVGAKAVKGFRDPITMYEILWK
ncbi:adenylate/guanylate cyclase domain-containing protein [Magnetospirillum sp. 64-120]|uniref:adenylate/guanylate cyclase domain-containing protein n=1 Tax=Magnetospirillum sp. 64-120 TaxID=1895778 RepID=UPI0025BF231B|nr:adenylate/guanylate cyclase domain-containing protein [Magnetospirillum sp. 64-120]